MSIYAQTETIDLLKNRNFDDWDFHFVDPAVKGTDIFAFGEEGVLKCKGMPFGYIATKKDYKNFKLMVDWIWPDGVEPTNSGVFLRVNGQPQESFLPRGVEVQLHNGNAGDLWAFHGMKIAGVADRYSDRPETDHGHIRGIKGLEKAEKEPGKWNRTEIVCVDGQIIVAVNGKIVNWTSDAETTPGKIGLQSEGGPVEFRNVILTPLP